MLKNNSLAECDICDVGLSISRVIALYSKCTSKYDEDFPMKLQVYQRVSCRDLQQNAWQKEESPRARFYLLFGRTLYESHCAVEPRSSEPVEKQRSSCNEQIG